MFIYAILAAVVSVVAGILIAVRTKKGEHHVIYDFSIFRVLYLSIVECVAFSLAERLSSVEYTVGYFDGFRARYSYYAECASISCSDGANCLILHAFSCFVNAKIVIFGFK